MERDASPVDRCGSRAEEVPLDAAGRMGGACARLDDTLKDATRCVASMAESVALFSDSAADLAQALARAAPALAPRPATASPEKRRPVCGCFLVIVLCTAAFFAISALSRAADFKFKR
jgi:hypothetical protein